MIVIIILVLLINIIVIIKQATYIEELEEELYKEELKR